MLTFLPFYLKFILCCPCVHKYTLLSIIRSYHYNPEYHRLGGYICPSGEASPQLKNRGREERRCRHYTFEQENAVERGGEGCGQWGIYISPHPINLCMFSYRLHWYRGVGLGFLKVRLEWPYNTPPGQRISDTTIKLEELDGLNDLLPRISCMAAIQITHWCAGRSFEPK